MRLLAVARLAVATATCSALAGDVAAWCGRSDLGDCFLSIRTGGEPGDAIGHARGIQFVHTRAIDSANDGAIGSADGSAGGSASNGAAAVAIAVDGALSAPQQPAAMEEVAFARISGVPNSGGEDVEVRFEVGGSVQATVRGDGELRAKRVFAAALTVEDGGLRIVRKERSTIELTATSADSDAATAADTAETKTTATTTWTVSNDGGAFAIAPGQGAKPVVKLAQGSPKHAVVVSAEGNVGIGTLWPSVKLDVNGGVQGSSPYSSASDERLKKDVVPLRDALAALRRLRPVRFRFRTDEFPERSFDDGEQVGLIAQEVERVLPEIVRTNAAGFKSVQYAALTPLLVHAVVEMANERDALAAEVRALAAAVQALHVTNDQ